MATGKADSSQEGSPDQAEQGGEANKQERRGTTVPLLLKGKERRPLSLLTPGSFPASLQVLVRAEGEQLILFLEKNE
ncbi:unnamed protein product [Pleuronectes platessa]|uniref:Uncharacterized protein n=1 Tax=Pleuronectes platessa TaxID=8262 RepID=A0A9N7Y9F7_PLEPL|nr:unnamed protein product [Pleuronectes platessa]